MSIMFVSNIPSNETVNLRQGPSRDSAVLIRVPYGAQVEAEPYDDSWHSACYDSRNGYMMSQYLVSTRPESDVCTGEGSAQIGVIRGTSVRVRAEPGTSAKILAYVNTGNQVTYCSGETFSASGYRWYRCTGTQWSGIGYIASDYVAPASDDNSDDAAASGAVSFTFSAEDAVTYAMSHSENSSGRCSKYNTSFADITGNNDCASFVSQCLCAGGMPMFDGWFYRLPGIPAGWTDSKWAVTYSGRARLLQKGWLSEVACDRILPGDIIYTYNANATPTPLTHVCIAVSANVQQNGRLGCRVCSYTSNRKDAFKPLSAPACRCYRISKTLKGNGSEKRVLLPLSGNGATVLPG